MPFRGLWNLITARGPGRLVAGGLFVAASLAVPALVVLVAARAVEG